MKKSDYIVAIVLLLLVVMAMKYFYPQESGLQVLGVLPETGTQQAEEKPSESVIRHPLPESPVPIKPPATESGPQQETPAEAPVETEPPTPLPLLDDSDSVVKQDLYTLAPRRSLDTLLNMDRIIRRFVVTVDNLPRKDLLKSKYRSNQSVGGQLIVEQDDNGFYLSKKNYKRYDAYIDLLEAMDSRQMIALYLHYYPLMQAAYKDMGYPSGYFNDRLIDVIDHLLGTPDTGGRVSLLRPHVLYLYADPVLEALPAGQKVLIRIGPRNAARVKSKLRELRQGLAGK